MSERSVRLDVFAELRVTEVAEVELHELRRNMRASRSLSLLLALPLLSMASFKLLSFIKGFFFSSYFVSWCEGKGKGQGGVSVSVCVVVFEMRKRREKAKGAD